MKRLRSIPRDYFLLAGIILLLGVLPLVITLNRFQINLATFILYWALLGTAWNIMGGYAGQFSFGHAAFYGLGAYTATVLLVDFSISPWIGMLVGAIIAGVFALATSYLSFRYGLKGPYFALATFAFAEMLRLISTEIEFINTSIGITLPLYEGDSWPALQFNDTPQNYYFAILGLLMIGLLVNIMVVNSKAGYYLQALREDEEAAAALGVNLLRYKTFSVVVSAMLTALAGAFFAQFFRFISPDLAFGVPVSIQILLRPIVGGIGTIWGPLIGAFFLTPLSEVTRAFVRTPPPFLAFIEGRSGVDEMLFAVILILVIIFLPDGIVGGVRRFWQRLRKPE
jgi:branched-chain amino acid transport system permease protein